MGVKFLILLCILISCLYCNQGVNKTDEYDCKVTKLNGYMFKECTNGTKELLISTEMGIDFYEITEIIDPCGDDIDNTDELLFKTINNEIIVFDEIYGQKTFIVLSEGDYTTTDRQRCYFHVFDGNVIWEN